MNGAEIIAEAFGRCPRKRVSVVFRPREGSFSDR